MLIALTLGAGSGVAEVVVKHPDQLEYRELDFPIPRAEKFRHVLSDGSVAYVVEDHSLPLFTVEARLRIGSFLEPADKVGLASLTGRMMRLGGAGSLDGAAFDERAAFLAAELDSSIDATTGSASVNCLSTQKAECLDLFFSMMREPRFDPARLQTEKENVLEDLKQRNDDPASLARREWRWLLYGPEHFASRMVTGTTLAAITRNDLVSFHRWYWQPASMVWSVSGDVDTKTIVAQLESRLAGWKPEGAKEVPWPPPVPRFIPEAGVYTVHKDIPQGRVQIGSLTSQRTDWLAPEDMAAELMNEILGGGGFTSRLTKRIRSDEGLAYSAGSGLNLGNYWPGTFTIFYQSKSETVAYAAAIAFEEVRRIRDDLISEAELETAKGAFRDSFPRNFESASSVASLFANDDILGRPHDYWTTYQDRVDRVTREDVQAAARKYLDPDSMVFLVVGDWQAINVGDADKRAKMSQFFGGKVHKLPERDPVTLEIKPGGGG